MVLAMRALIHCSLALVLLLSACDSADTTLVIPQEGLLAYYSFEGSALDASGNENHGAVFGASLTHDRFGNEKNAYHFDGVDDHIIVPHSSGIDLGAKDTSYSLSLWVNATGPRRSRIVEKWNENPRTSYPFSLRAEPDDFNGAIYDGQLFQTVSVDSPWNGQWHHIVYTVDADTDMLHLYLDGDLAASQPKITATPTSNENDMYLGGGPNVDRYFSGQLDDLLLYNRVLSAEEVAVLYRLNDWSE